MLVKWLWMGCNPEREESTGLGSSETTGFVKRSRKWELLVVVVVEFILSYQYLVSFGVMICETVLNILSCTKMVFIILWLSAG